MNENEKTPVLAEELIETIQDNFIGPDDMAHCSHYLKLQYENSTKEKQEAMDVVMVCLTQKTLKAMISINDSINKENKNVG
jgi:hypothetical protein